MRREFGEKSLRGLMAAEIGQSYEFENFRLDPREKILFCDDKPLSLTPKVFETLQILVEHPGHLLQKDVLIQKLWQDRFVAESNLTFNIKMLRRALHDNPRAPRFIETVPRRGYRFIAQVREKSAPILADTSAPVPISIGPNHEDLIEQKGTGRGHYLSRIKPGYLSIAVASILLIGAALIALRSSRTRLFASPSTPILSTPFKSEPLTNSGSVHAAITPDGKYVAYTSETGAKQSIWLRQLETAENIQIVPPSDNLYLGLVISHDGKSLYFVRRGQFDQATSSIFRVGTFGGVPTKVVEKAEGWVSVSPDDRQLSFVRCNYRDDDYCSLFVVGVDGNNEQRLLTRQRPNRIGDSQFSPDGKSIAFAAGQSWNGASDFHLMRLDLTRGVETQISSHKFFNIKNLKWLPDGDSLLLAVKENPDGRLRIWQVSAANGDARPVTKDAMDYISLSLDQAAKKIVATRVSNTFHLYLAQAGDMTNVRMLDAALVGLTFTPDGKILYAKADGNIWTIDRDGTEQRQLTSAPFSEFSPLTSADGGYVFYTSNRSGSNQVWRMNVDGTNQTQITKREGGYPRFVSPDGKTLYFESCLHQTLWRVRTDGSGEESQVLPGRVMGPAFSPDGMLVAYSSRGKDGQKITVVSVGDWNVQKALSLADNQSDLVRIAWAPNNKTLYYVTEKASRNSLWQQSLDGQPPVLLGDLGSEEMGEFTVSPDGKSFGFIRGKWIHDAVLIEGLK